MREEMERDEGREEKDVRRKEYRGRKEGYINGKRRKQISEGRERRLRKRRKRTAGRGTIYPAQRGSEERDKEMKGGRKEGGKMGVEEKKGNEGDGRSTV